MTRPPFPGEAVIVAALSDALDGCPGETLDAFDALFRADPPIRTAKQWASAFGMNERTLGSRFRLSGLPSLKRYVAESRMVLAAFALDDPHVSCTAAADRLRFSSPQAFARTAQTLGYGTPTQFRMTCNGRAMLEAFVDAFIAVHRDTLRTTTLFGRRRFVPIRVAA
jgi:AraC-like DNA-binding protein